jgi:anti-anti-sigma factor
MLESRILLTERDGQLFVILPTGEAGGFAGDQISLEVDVVLAELDELAAKDVVVDFGNVTFFGSCLLAAIQRVWKHMNRVGGQVALCRVPDVGREVLRVARFDELWSVFPTREDARNALLAQTTATQPDPSLNS